MVINITIKFKKLALRIHWGFCGLRFSWPITLYYFMNISSLVLICISFILAWGFNQIVLKYWSFRKAMEKLERKDTWAWLRGLVLTCNATSTQQSYIWSQWEQGFCIALTHHTGFRMLIFSLFSLWGKP